MFRLAFVIASAFLSLGVSSSAQDNSHVVVLPDQIVWGPASPKLPPGAQISVIYGDMTRPGELYSFRAKLPDGYRVAPHTHPMDEHVTVLAGTMMLGFGEQRDDARMQALPTGSYVTLPRSMPHYNRMQGETILQFHGVGPYDINYVNPEDDPSRQWRSAA
jgi:mannose-6-phosphate isomerase-like protein (cupin superfamily)